MSAELMLGPWLQRCRRSRTMGTDVVLLGKGSTLARPVTAVKGMERALRLAWAAIARILAREVAPFCLFLSQF